MRQLHVSDAGKLIVLARDSGNGHPPPRHFSSSAELYRRGHAGAENLPTPARSKVMRSTLGSVGTLGAGSGTYRTEGTECRQKAVRFPTITLHQNGTSAFFIANSKATGNRLASTRI